MHSPSLPPMHVAWSVIMPRPQRLLATTLHNLYRHGLDRVYYLSASLITIWRRPMVSAIECLTIVREILHLDVGDRITVPSDLPDALGVDMSFSAGLQEECSIFSSRSLEASWVVLGVCIVFHAPTLTPCVLLRHCWVPIIIYRVISGYSVSRRNLFEESFLKTISRKLPQRDKCDGVSK